MTVKYVSLYFEGLNKFKYRNEVQLVIYTSGQMFISQITNLSFRPMMSLFWILAFWEI